MDPEKMKVLLEIERHGERFHKVPGRRDEYVIRCPFCGDSDNPTHAHCYIHCSDDPHEPLKWHCFKCPGTPNGGIVGPRFLKALGINPAVLKNTKFDVPKNRIEGIREEIYVPKTDVNLHSFQVEYIERRLGKFEDSDYEKFKILWDTDVLIPFAKTRSERNTIPSNMNSISFLTQDNRMVLTRGFGEDCEWKKRLLDRNSSGSHWYTIESEIDLFTDGPIYVSIGEGIFDVLSAYRNFREEGFNLFLAALGSDYVGAVEHVIAMGIVGSNVIVRIYMDTDRDEWSLRESIRRYKPVFGKIVIRTNAKYKDIGVTADRIRIVERKVV